MSKRPAAPVRSASITQGAVSPTVHTGGAASGIPNTATPPVQRVSAVHEQLQPSKRVHGSPPIGTSEPLQWSAGDRTHPPRVFAARQESVGGRAHRRWAFAARQGPVGGRTHRRWAFAARQGPDGPRTHAI